MARGDIYEATAGDSSDVYYVDTGMYDVAEYGSIYVIDDERPALIDTGIGTHDEVLLDAVAEIGIAPEEIEVIAPTHAHLDHAGGAGFLVEECPNADVYVYETAASLLIDPTALWKGTREAVGSMIKHYVEPKPVPEERLVELTDGDTLDLGEHTLDVHHAPGHAFHQAVFYDRAVDGVFTADAAGIFTPGLDRARHSSPPPGFHLEKCLADVELLQKLDPSALYYGHFGDRPTGDILSEYADVLESWVDRVAEKRAELGDDESVAEYFAERVDVVDAWGEEKAREEERMNVRGVLHYLDSEGERTQ